MIITKNAGSRLIECLESLRFVSEIVIVDSGSTDKTEDVAARYGARFIEHGWLGFGKQKQFAVKQAKNDWVLAIDADERVSKSLQEKIIAEMRAPGYRVYKMRRRNRFMGRWLKHGEGYPDWNVRLFDRRCAQWSDDTVHEKVLTTEKIGMLHADILHESEETLGQYLEKQNRYTTLQAQNLAGKSRSILILKLLYSPLFRFLKFYILRLGFMDGLPGFVHISVGCFNSFIKNAKALGLYKK